MAEEESSVTLRAMADELVHRGPDGSGTWIDSEAGVWLAHRRLSIIDLSDAGRQPMISATGRFVITFNGEIYNFRLLRQELERQGSKFRGHSDTEVMLCAIEAWGVNEAVRRFAGMFAFALWDREEQALYLARDRLGKKPLYFSAGKSEFLFGSELKALSRHPSFDPQIDPVSVALMLKYSYVPGSRSIYRDSAKLAPGHVLRVIRNAVAGYTLTPHRYWNEQEVFAVGAQKRFHGSFDAALGELDVLLRDATSQRMVADVPLGAFLSGGIDSSVVVAAMQSLSTQPIRTFTVGFRDDRFNEAHHARDVAEHLGTAHTEIYLEPGEALEVLPRMPQMFDEPFADASQIPTYLVSSLARRSVTVALSGDGGDELFAGYRRYFRWRQMWTALRVLPASVRWAIASILRRLPVRLWNAVLSPVAGLLDSGAGSAATGQQIHKLAQVLSMASQDEVYDWLLTVWSQPPVEVNSQALASALSVPRQAALSVESFFHRMSMLDVGGYLTDDILVKVDRASMANSLEVRAPLLDHRIVEFAATLPHAYRVDDKGGKRVLRELAYRYVPQRLLDRPKTGFGVPVDDWLRGPLRSWAGDLLSADGLARSGILTAAPIMEKLRLHLTGAENWGAHLWNVLMFQSWYLHSRSGLRRG